MSAGAIMRENATLFSPGLLIGCMWLVSSIVSASAVLCNCKHLNICNQCNHIEEAHNLTCFGHRVAKEHFEYQCQWNLGRYSAYDLFIMQRTCKNVTRVFAKNMTSEAFTPALKSNMTAYAVGLSDDQKRCTIAKFSGHPTQIINCGPPDIDFKRSSGHLKVTTKWKDSNVNKYHLKYRKSNTTQWTEVISQDNCIVSNLTSFLSYEIQIQCVVTPKCPQCPLSEIIKVPQEFVDAPVINKVHYDLIQPGQRSVIVTWEYVHRDAVENYNVTVQKMSGEPVEESSYLLKVPNITLILSYSAYEISINAFNKAGPSPAAHIVIDFMQNLSDLNGEFNVSVNNDSFSLTWNNTLSKKYHCYSIDWWTTGEKLASEFFYATKNVYRVQTKKVALQPYKRYNFLLHARQEKDPCNLRKINNSDQTYGRAQVYFREGTPLTAPANLTVANVTQRSFVITWSPVAEEDLQGFLRGYIIRYIDRSDNVERNVSVGPNVNSYELENLKSRSVYDVRLSAYTAAGEGECSDFQNIETLDSSALLGMLAGVLVGVIALLIAIHLCCRYVQRFKSLLWPSVPNPYNSNAVKKIDGAQELEIIENFEETEEHVCVLEIRNYSVCNIPLISWKNIKDTFNPVLVSDTSTVIEKMNAPQSSTSTRTDSTSAEPFHIDTNHSDSVVAPSIDTDCNNSGPDDLTEPLNPKEKESISTSVYDPTTAFVSDYTTMELFQQITKLQGSSEETSNPETVPSKTGQDYIRQVLSQTHSQQIERSYQ